MTTAPGISVRQMRWRTRSVIAGYRAARRATARALRQSLLRHRAEVIASLRTAFVGAESPAAASPAPAERTSLWELWPISRDDASPKADRSDELLQVVHIVQKHPEGICARDIGNELGTDWRRVLGLTRSLVESGLIDQVDQAFYPIAKARR